jgi:hypothetical protein
MASSPLKVPKLRNFGINLSPVEKKVQNNDSGENSKSSKVNQFTANFFTQENQRAVNTLATHRRVDSKATESIILPEIREKYLKGSMTERYKHNYGSKISVRKGQSPSRTHRYSKNQGSAYYNNCQYSKDSNRSRTLSPEYSRQSIGEQDRLESQIEYEFNTQSYMDSLNNVRDRSYANLKNFLLKESNKHDLSELYSIQMTDPGASMM